MAVRLNGCPTLWSAAKIRDAGNDAYVYHFAYHPDKPRGYDGAGTGDWAGLACHGANASHSQLLVHSHSLTQAPPCAAASATHTASGRLRGLSQLLAP